MAKQKQNPQNNDTSPKKKKGIFRWEAILPAALILGLIYLYMIYFFDNHLRRGLELGGTYAVGAEVNIEDLSLSFLNAELKVSGLQVTNKEKATHNLIEIGKINFHLLWDALLRAKGVVENAEILEIQVDSKRKSPGRVLPKEKSDGPGLVAHAQELALNKVRSQYDKTILADVAALLEGASPQEQLDKIKASLQSVTKAQEIEKFVQEKKVAWEKRIQSLPKNEDFKAYEARLKAIKLDRFQNVQEIQQSLSEVDSLYREINSKINEVKTASKDFKADLNDSTNSVKSIEAAIRSDIADLQGKLKIPKLDTKSIGQALFGELVLKRLQSVLEYSEKIKAYMPPPKTPEEIAAEKAQELTPKERAIGKTYTFPITKGYPLFWLKRAALSSIAKPGAAIGNLSGTLTDATSNPAQINKPMVLKFAGGFPASQISGVDGVVTIDHRTTLPKQNLKVRVGSFPLPRALLSDAKEAKFGWESANGSSNLEFDLQNKDFIFSLNSAMSNIQYIADSSVGRLDEILKGIVGDMPRLTVDSRLQGSLTSLENLRFDLKSNVGEVFEASFRKQLDIQIEKAKLEAKAYVESQINSQKERLNAEISKLETQLGVPLRNKEETVKALEAKLETAKNQIIENQKRGLENKVKEEGNKLLKGLGDKIKF